MADTAQPGSVAFGHDPDASDPATAGINACALEDLSDDNDMFASAETMALFVKGHAVHGDVHAFAKAMACYIRGGRMSAYDRPMTSRDKFTEGEHLVSAEGTSRDRFNFGLFGIDLPGGGCW